MSAPSLQELESYRSVYRDGLLKDTLPFWLPRCIDREHGGYLTALGEDGTVLQTDKSVWFQGRFAWMLSTLYQTVEPRAEWLEGPLSSPPHAVVLLAKARGRDPKARRFFGNILTPSAVDSKSGASSNSLSGGRRSRVGTSGNLRLAEGP